MNERPVVVVGSGPVGAAVAYTLAMAGHEVEVFEKGPDYPYPHEQPFEEQVGYLHEDPRWVLPADLKHVEQSGSYSYRLDEDLFQVTGGAGTRWAALALRMVPNDFRTRSALGYGTDWPVTYDDLEPWYARAEAHLGVAGTDADNPYAPPRSRPHPLPPVELSWDDRRMAAGLQSAGIVLHTSAQARVTAAWPDRTPCVNLGTCWVCPVGARYSPGHHLHLAVATGRCRVHGESSVRRVLVDAAGRARGIVVRGHSAPRDTEVAAAAVVLAAGAIETARLLLNSADERHRDGLGNHSGHVGQELLFHHAWHGKLRFDRALHPQRVGLYTGQSWRFVDGPERRASGGIKIEFPFKGEPGEFHKVDASRWRTGADAVRALGERAHWHPVRMHCEAIAGPEKSVVLGRGRDRFGDRLAHVRYSLNERDHAVHAAARAAFERCAEATRAQQGEFAPPGLYHSSAHHMGGGRMSARPADGVTDPVGAVHGVRNLYLAGGSTFVSTGSVNPTLSMVALALRTADHLLERVPRA